MIAKIFALWNVKINKNQDKIIARNCVADAAMIANRSVLLHAERKEIKDINQRKKGSLYENPSSFFCMVTIYIGGRCLLTSLHTNESTNKTKKITNKILAISIEMISTPLKPKSPATMARIKNTITKSIMNRSFFWV